MTIYLITNLINGKQYVGQTIRELKYRFSRHISDALIGKSKMAIHIAIRKYEPKNFNITILESCSSIEEMNKKEAYYIKHLNTLSPNGYNLTTGGYNSSHCEETRRKISQANKGRVPHNKGKKQNKDTIAKRVEALTGKKLSNAHKDKLSKVRKKPIMCIETKQIFPSTKDAAEQMGIFASNIFKVLNGEYKHAKGYTFRYI